MRVPNGVQEDDVSWHQGVIWCQEGGSHGQNQPKEEHGSFRDCKKKKWLHMALLHSDWTCLMWWSLHLLNSVKETHLWSSPMSVLLACLSGAQQRCPSWRVQVRFWPSANAVGTEVTVDSKISNTIDKKTALTSSYPHCDFSPNMEEVELLLLLPCLNEMLKFRASLGNEPALPCTDLWENGLGSIATQ